MEDSKLQLADGYDMDALREVYRRALANRDEVSAEDMIVLDSLSLDSAEPQQIGDDGPIIIDRPRWGSKTPYKKDVVRAKAKAAKKARKQNRR